MAKSTTPRARRPSFSNTVPAVESTPSANSNAPFGAVQYVELVREVSSLVTQVKFMWAIGAAIILAIIGSAWSLSTTMSELNRTMGNLQGTISAQQKTGENLISSQSSESKMDAILKPPQDLDQQVPTQKGDLDTGSVKSGNNDVKPEFMDAPKKN